MTSALSQAASALNVAVSELLAADSVSRRSTEGDEGYEGSSCGPNNGKILGRQPGHTNK
jgi:hypothetical protein